jgi:hypothetical protein
VPQKTPLGPESITNDCRQSIVPPPSVSLRCLLKAHTERGECGVSVNQEGSRGDDKPGNGESGAEDPVGSVSSQEGHRHDNECGF